ncbi:MAG: cation:proton antiporter [Nocardioidaceae bacterium]
MITQTIFSVTVLVLCYTLVSGWVKRGPLTPALVFVTVGVLLGPDVLGIINVRPGAEGFKILLELALTLILFNQAARLDVRTVLRGKALPRRLIRIGIPLSLALGSLAALLVLPVLPFWEAFVLAVVVAPTEAALVESLVENRRIPSRIREGLSVESGIYDGFAIAALLTFLAVASQQADPAPGHWIGFGSRTVVLSVAVGAATGFLGGKAVAFSRSRGWMTESWTQLGTLALAIFCFALGEEVHGSGFVAAFAGGLAYATVIPSDAERPSTTDVAKAAGELLELVAFAMIGALLVVPAFRDADWRIFLFAVLALALRVGSVALAMIRSGLSTRSVLFMGWFGPRGIATLVLALVVLEDGRTHEHLLIAQVAIVTVTISIVLHSLTAPFGIRWLHAEDEAPEPAATQADGGPAAPQPRADDQR